MARKDRRKEGENKSRDVCVHSSYFGAALFMTLSTFTMSAGDDTK